MRMAESQTSYHHREVGSCTPRALRQRASRIFYSVVRISFSRFTMEIPITCLKCFRSIEDNRFRFMYDQKVTIRMQMEALVYQPLKSVSSRSSNAGLQTYSVRWICSDHSTSFLKAQDRILGMITLVPNQKYQSQNRDQIPDLHIRNNLRLVFKDDDTIEETLYVQNLKVPVENASHFLEKLDKVYFSIVAVLPLSRMPQK